MSFGHSFIGRMFKSAFYKWCKHANPTSHQGFPSQSELERRIHQGGLVPAGYFTICRALRARKTRYRTNAASRCEIVQPTLSQLFAGRTLSVTRGWVPELPRIQDTTTDINQNPRGKRRTFGIKIKDCPRADDIATTCFPVHLDCFALPRLELESG